MGLISPLRFGIFLVCKNNYELLESWIESWQARELPLLILDIGSNNPNLKLADKLKQKYKFDFKIAGSSIMQENILEAISHFKNKGINWVIYTHHDTYPLTKNWTTLLNDTLKSLSKKYIGAVGLNIYHDQEIETWTNNSKYELKTTARSPLELGNGYYDSRPGSRVDYNYFNKSEIYLIETPMWTTCLFNSNYIDIIKIDKNFNFFHSIDDICFQYLYKNIFNVVIPHISFAHDQSIKIKKGFQKNSSSGNKKKIESLYGRFDHLDIWKNKWKFNYSLSKKFFGPSFTIAKIIDKIERSLGKDFSSSFQTIARSSFEYQEYTGTLLYEFYQHDPKYGPLKYL